MNAKFRSTGANVKAGGSQADRLHQLASYAGVGNRESGGGMEHPQVILQDGPPNAGGKEVVDKKVQLRDESDGITCRMIQWDSGFSTQLEVLAGPQHTGRAPQFAAAAINWFFECDLDEWNRRSNGAPRLMLHTSPSTEI